MPTVRLRPWYYAENAEIYAAWRKLNADLSPQDYFRSEMKIEALLPPRPNVEECEGFHRYPLKQFWDEQQRFELAVGLVAALQKPAFKKGEFIRRALAIAGKEWKIKTDKEL